MSANEKFLTQRQRYQPETLPQDFSDEEMARDWTLSEADKKEIGRYRTNSRLFVAINCAPFASTVDFWWRSTTFRRV